MKNIKQFTLIILLITFTITIISCGKKYEIVEPEYSDFIYLKEKGAIVDNGFEKEQMYDYGRRMLDFRLPAYNMDSGDYYMVDSIFDKFNYELNMISGDKYGTGSINGLVTSFMKLITIENDLLDYNTIKGLTYIFKMLDEHKGIKNNLVKSDFLVPYYLIKVMYAHTLISTIGDTFTDEAEKVINSEMNEYFEIINKEEKDFPWYSKMKEYDKVFGTHMVDYVDMVRELTIQAKDKEYGNRRPIWIFHNNKIEKEWNELNHSLEDEEHEKFYNVEHVQYGDKRIANLEKLMDEDTLDYEKVKAKIR